MGENGERLGAGEAGADADAGTAAEGDVLEAMEADLAFGQKAVGVEGIGIVPQLLVAVDDPRPYGDDVAGRDGGVRSEEHTSELQSLMRISYAVFCLKKKT